MAAESERKVHRVSEASDKIIRSFAKSRGLEVGEAIDKLVKVADSRVGALERYAMGREEKPRKKAKKRAS